ncbi:kielin/chordin-like protein [Rhinatrema bivittatum]|uniref:kielin/chordin-like protein n=1 Tax=Rhinatrema bivittatum TaxID=194408 RepID=UPI00112D14DA|nr:kielin/chordin-like protein [Rhinatrema bivittatum]
MTCDVGFQLTETVLEGACCPVFTCVPKFVCTTNDQEYQAGQTWQNNCVDYHCDADSLEIIPAPHPCTTFPPAQCQEGEVSVAQQLPNDPCCKKTVCVCDIRSCSTPPTCPSGYKSVEDIPEGVCCPSVTCVCDSNACSPTTTTCNPGFNLVTTIPDGSCCPVVSCEPMNLYVNNGTSYPPGATWTNNCLDYSYTNQSLVIVPHPCGAQSVTCTQEGQVSVTVPDPSDPCCSNTVCACDISSCSVTSKTCGIGYQPSQTTPEGECCPVFSCEPKNVCVSNGQEYSPGATWETDCGIYSCSNQSVTMVPHSCNSPVAGCTQKGAVSRTIQSASDACCFETVCESHFAECDMTQCSDITTCNQGENIVETVSENECCPTLSCEIVPVVVTPNGDVHQPETTWQENCLIYTYDSKGSLSVVNYTCDLPPDDVECTQKGEVLKPQPLPNDPCCFENVCECDIRTCNSPQITCNLGFEPVETTAADSCCPDVQCQAKHVCVFNGKEYQPDDKWYANCTSYNCDVETLMVNQVPHPCAPSTIVNCMNNGEVLKQQPMSTDPCCTETVCVCDTSTCKIASATCDPHYKLVTTTSEDSCCPIYSCELITTCTYNGIEHEVGFTWQENCYDYTCDPELLQVLTVPHPCAYIPVTCTQKGEVLQNQTLATDPCCTEEVCVCDTRTCGISLCEPGYLQTESFTLGSCCPTIDCECDTSICSPSSNQCNPGERAVEQIFDGCCSTVTCEIIDECTFLNETYQPGETWNDLCFNFTCTNQSLEITLSFVVDIFLFDDMCMMEGEVLITVENPDTPCCPITMCVCDISTCNQTSLICPEGFQPNGTIPEGACCPVFICVPNYVCMSNGTEYLPGEQWTVGCTMHTCKSQELTIESYQCAPPTPIQCNKTDEVVITKPDDANPCCQQYVCECDITQCSAVTKTCDPGYVMVETTSEDSCCPNVTCKPIEDRCIGTNGQMYQPGETWNDLCFNYTCTNQSTVPFISICETPSVVECLMEGQVPITQQDPNNPCCQETVCECDVSTCSVTSMTCGVGSQPESYFPKGACCPVFTCVGPSTPTPTISAGSTTTRVTISAGSSTSGVTTSATVAKSGTTTSGSTPSPPKSAGPTTTSVSTPATVAKSGTTTSGSTPSPPKSAGPSTTSVSTSATVAKSGTTTSGSTPSPPKSAGPTTTSVSTPATVAKSGTTTSGSTPSPPKSGPTTTSVSTPATVAKSGTTTSGSTPSPPKSAGPSTTSVSTSATVAKSGTTTSGSTPSPPKSAGPTTTSVSTPATVAKSGTTTSGSTPSPPKSGNFLSSSDCCSPVLIV